MKTNILFACLILMLSPLANFNAFCAASPQEERPRFGFPWCCFRKPVQRTQDVAPPLPAAVVAPAAPQTDAPTNEEIAAQKKAAGASTVDALIGKGWGDWLSSSALVGLGGLSLAAEQQKRAAVEKIGASTAQLTHQLTLQGEQIVESALPVAEALGAKLFNTVAPKAQQSAELLAMQAGNRVAGALDDFIQRVTGILPRERSPFERLCDNVSTYGPCACVTMTTVLVPIMGTYLWWKQNP